MPTDPNTNRHRQHSGGLVSAVRRMLAAEGEQPDSPAPAVQPGVDPEHEPETIDTREAEQAAQQLSDEPGPAARTRRARRGGVSEAMRRLAGNDEPKAISASVARAASTRSKGSLVRRVKAGEL